MSEKIKVGIIGTGQIGTSHIRNYSDIDEVEIVAVCDIDEKAAHRAAELSGAEKVFTDFRQMLELDALTSVDVCLHNNLHAPVAIAAMEAGKHVYCEKPLAGSYIDARAMLEARKEHGVKLHMQAATIFSPATRAAEKLIGEGHLGEPYYARSSFYRRRGRPFVDGYGSAQFVQQDTAGGGALFDMGVYHITQILHLLDGPEIRTISGATHQEIPMYEDRRESSGYDVEELATGFVRLEEGITFYIEEAWAIHQPGGGGCSSAILGSQGGINLDPFSYHTTIADLEIDADVQLDMIEGRRQLILKGLDPYGSPQEHWVAGLLGEVELIDTARLGADMMLIAEGIYLSQKLDREVTAEEVREASTSTARDL